MKDRNYYRHQKSEVRDKMRGVKEVKNERSDTNSIWNMCNNFELYVEQ